MPDNFFVALNNPLTGSYKELKAIAKCPSKLNLYNAFYIAAPPTPKDGLENSIDIFKEEGFNNFLDPNFQFALSCPIHSRTGPLNQSSLAILVEKVIDEILNKNELKKAELRRSALNITLHRENKRHTSCLPHVDNNSPHLVMICYLNTTGGDTVLTNKIASFESYDDMKFFIEDYDDNGAARIAPEEDKIILFDGKRYHYNESPSLGEQNRLVLVANFTLQQEL